MLRIRPSGALEFMESRDTAWYAEHGFSSTELILKSNFYLPKMEAPPPNNVVVHLRLTFQLAGDPNPTAEFLRRHHMAFIPLERANVLPACLVGDVCISIHQGYGEVGGARVTAMTFVTPALVLIGTHDGRPCKWSPADAMRFVRRWLKVANVVERSSMGVIHETMLMCGRVQLGDTPVSVDGAAGSGSTQVAPVYIDKSSCWKCGEPLARGSASTLECAVCRGAAFCATCGVGEHCCPGTEVSATRTTNLGNFTAPPTCAAPGCGTHGTPETPLLRCGGCKHALYCSRACQLADWRARHRKACSGSGSGSGRRPATPPTPVTACAEGVAALAPGHAALTTLLLDA